MAQKVQRSILPNQRTLLELVEGKEAPAVGNRENRPTSLSCTAAASSLAVISSSKADESPVVDAKTSPGLATSPPTFGSVNMENLEGVQMKEFDHYPSMRRNASAPINLSCTTGGSATTGATNGDSNISKNSESSDITAEDGSQSGDESIKSDDKSVSSSQNGMMSSQSVPEYLTTDDSAVRKRSPKLGKKNKSVRRSAPWYSVLQSNYKSRSEEFLKLFKGIPDTERLTVDYSCAIQKEILVHGRMYVTQNYLCFYANIFKWETTLIIKLKDITAVTKERTVRFIPNALQVTTASEKYFFTSFGSRDKSFMTLFKLWQNSLMDLKMAPTEFWKWIHNNYGDDLGIPEDELPEDYVFPSKDADDSGDDKSKSQVSECQGSDGDDLSLSEARDEQMMKEAVYMDENLETNENSTTASPLLSSLGPPRIDISDYSETEEEVSCSCKDQHQGKQYLNEVFGVSCDKLFQLLFADDSQFYEDYVKARKSTDINIGKWILEEESPQETRTVTYTFPINSNIGPKTTQVTETQTFHRDISKDGSCYIAVNKVVNKGIPYSDNFHVLGRWCITRVSAHKCRLCVHADVCFIKASWFIKSIIEKQVHVGLKNGYIFLGKYLREKLEIIGKRRKAKRRRNPSSKEEENEAAVAQRLLKKNISVQDQNIGYLSYLLPSWLRGTQLNSRPIMFVVCLVLFLLVIVNISLYSQLQHLEHKTLDVNVWSKSEIFEKLDRVPTSDEDWRNLIKQQQIFHEEELRKWREIISLCVQLMKQMESALEELKADIDPISSLAKLDKYVNDALGSPQSSHMTEKYSQVTVETLQLITVITAKCCSILYDTISGTTCQRCHQCLKSRPNRPCCTSLNIKACNPIVMSTKWNSNSPERTVQDLGLPMAKGGPKELEFNPIKLVREQQTNTEESPKTRHSPRLVTNNFVNEHFDGCEDSRPKGDVIVETKQSLKLDLTFYRAHSPLYRTMEVFGLWNSECIVKDSCIRPKSNLKKVCNQRNYTIFVLFVLWTNTLRFFPAFFVGAELDPSRLYFKIIYMAFILQVALNQSVLVWATWKEKRIASFFHQWESDIQSNSDSEMDLLWVRRWSKRVAVIGIAWVVLHFFNSCGAVFSPIESIRNASAIFTAPFEANYGLHIFVIFCNFYGFAAWIFPIMTFILTCREFTIQLKKFNERFEEAVDEAANQGVFLANFEQFRRQHQTLCVALNHANNYMYTYINLIAYATMVPLACFLMYQVLFSRIEANFSACIMYTIWLSSIFFNVCVESWIAAVVNSQAHSPVNTIYNIVTKDISNDRQMQMNMFLSRLNGDVIGFTIFDFVTITKPFILTIGGLAITYYALIAEFQ